MLNKWRKYFSHIYNLRVNDNNKETLAEFDRVGISESGILSYIYYKTERNYNEVGYFKYLAFYNCIKDAYKHKYNKILIIWDDMKFLDEHIDLCLSETVGKFYTVLNPKDINENCIAIDSTVINYMFSFLGKLTKNWYYDLYDKVKTNFVINSSSEWMCKHKIDYVVRYVDNSDPQWKSQFNAYKSEGGMKKPYLYDAYPEMFIYNINKVKKCMPFVNKIYVVVSSLSQLPEGLPEDVNIVLHNDIIPARYLPTFNSHTIDMFIDKIPNLSEHFIYADDDMYTIKAISRADMFCNGKIYNDIQAYDYVDTNYLNVCANDFKLINAEFNLEKQALKCTHRPQPMLKSTYIHIWEVYKNDIESSFTRFRKNCNYNYYIFILYNYFSGIAEVSKLTMMFESLKLNFNDRNITTLKKYFDAVGKKHSWFTTNIISEHTPNNSKNNNVIYTCITGGYDALMDPVEISEGYDYVCFTDNTDIKSDVWDIRPIPEELLSLSPVKQQRCMKINPHKYLSEYELSIWVDGSVTMVKDVNEAINKLDFDNYDIFIPTHPERDCIYEEAKAIVSMAKDTAENVNPMIELYKSEGMPEHNGLAETNVVVRKHNSQACIDVMNMWWHMLNTYSHRDQLSFNYAIWKLNCNRFSYLYDGYNRTKYFYWNGGSHKMTNICIVHYNTPELTNALIKSIHKYMKRTRIYLFDNSTDKPFTYRYNDLVYLDNTKGQYINFDEWLKQYPTRLKSKEKTQTFGSAKHSISVQKCMEIINDNFILMDSDILIKRDISGFINRKFVYVGESEQQGNGLYRVLPYILYINVPMCKQYNVTWFDPQYMHGLHMTKEGDKYDTGGAFFVKTRDLPYKEVKLKSFIEHYKGGSWEDTYNEYKGRNLSSEEWLQKNKKYWE